MKIQITRSKVNMTEFSKRMVAVMCTLWIVGAIFGGYICFHDPNQLSYLLDYIKEPVTVGVVGYLAKSAFENPAKIKASAASVANQTTTTPAGEPYQAEP